MDPNSGRIYTDEQMADLRKRDPERADSLVLMHGKREDIERIGQAVAALNRADRRAAKRAERRKGR